MRRLLASPILHGCLVVALALALFVPGLGASGYAHAEAFRVQPAYEMMQSGDYVAIRLFEQAYLRKPPGMPWAVALSTWLLGAGEFASRFVSAAAVAAGALLSLVFAQHWFGRPFGLIAGLAFVLAPAFWWYPPIARSAEIEALHNLFVVAGALCILQTLLPLPFGESRSWARIWPLALLTAVALTGALFTKGPAGVPVFAAACIAGWIIRARSGQRSRDGAGVWLASLVPFVIALGLLGWWAWAAHRRVSGESIVVESPTLFLFRPQQLLEIASLPIAVLIAALPTSLGVLAIAWYRRSATEQAGSVMRSRAALALALTIVLAVLGYMLTGVSNNRYALPAIALMPAACGAGAWVLVQRARTFAVLERHREKMRLRRLAWVMFTLLLSAAIFSAWYGEHRRNTRTSGKAFGVELGAYFTHPGELWADQVIDTRPEVVMAAVQIAGARNIAIRPRWMPVSLWRREHGEASVPLPPAGSYLLLRTDDLPRRDQYELDEEREYAPVMEQLREVHRGMVHNFEYRLYEVVAKD